MRKPAIILDKRFVRAEVHFSEAGIVCYQADESTGIRLSDWIEYAIDTIRGSRKGTDTYVLKDVRILVEIGDVLSAEATGAVVELSVRVRE